MSRRCLLVYATEFGVVHYKTIVAGPRDKRFRRKRLLRWPDVWTMDRELDSVPRRDSEGGASMSLQFPLDSVMGSTELNLRYSAVFC